MKNQLKKHAYLIIAHKSKEQLYNLIRLLDDERNDLYFNIDRKSNIDPQTLRSAAYKSNLYFVSSIHARWGTYDLIETEIKLLKKACQRGYEFYHLISGEDLPIKSQDEIHDFFDMHRQNNFVRCVTVSHDLRMEINCRLKQYTFFKNNSSKLNKISFKIQEILRVNRLDSTIEYGRGSNWFSINHQFALYVLTKEKWIKKNFIFTQCGDEIFLQTIILNSPYAESLVWNGEHSISEYCRLIEWAKGGGCAHPHIYTVEDYDYLITSDAMFARKFDWSVDRNIIEKISSRIIKQNVYPELFTVAD